MRDKVFPTIQKLTSLYNQDQNIIEYLKRESGLPLEDIIEISYDIQAGSYIRSVKENPGSLIKYISSLVDVSKSYINDSDILLDCGTGEMTTISAYAHHLNKDLNIMACDLSVSRLKAGRNYINEEYPQSNFNIIDSFVADIAHLPLPDNCIDVVLTFHALEPNGGREKELLSELVRVSNNRIILFEPSWEHANEEIKGRMRKHGYIKNIPQIAKELEVEIEEIRKLSYSINPLNPTYCFVLKKNNSGSVRNIVSYMCPQSHTICWNKETYYYSKQGGWAYPIIGNIPCFRNKHAIFMSHDQ